VPLNPARLESALPRDRAKVVVAVQSLVALSARAYHRDMEANEQNPVSDKAQEPERAVPEKQIYRWKDDGGALPPEPAPKPAQDRD
jgi:hypothetical protein